MGTLGQNNSKNIFVDNLDNVYIIQKDKISKLDKDGKLVANFSYKNSGEISSIDVTDPLKIVVFYKSFGQLIFLDNTLSITKGPVSLFEKDVVNPVLVCTSSDKGLWIYDKQDFTIFKFDDNLKLITRISDIPMLIGSDFDPVFMISINSFLYFSDPKEGIFIFDQYGTMYKKLNFKDILYFDIVNNSIIYFTKGLINKIDMLTYSESKMNLTDKTFISQTFKDNFIYLLKADGISFSKIKLSFNK